jgi:hypothetical protein
MESSIEETNDFHNLADREARMHNKRFGNIAGDVIYSQLFVRKSALVPADEKHQAIEMNFQVPHIAETL